MASGRRTSAWRVAYLTAALLAACGGAGVPGMTDAVGGASGLAGEGAASAHAGTAAGGAAAGGTAPGDSGTGGQGAASGNPGMAGQGATSGDLGMAGEGGANGGAAGAVYSGGAGGEPEVAGDSGESGQGLAGTNASSGAAGAEGDATGSIQLNDLGDYQVVQRVLGGSAQRVQIAGTFAGSIASVQAQVVSFATGSPVIVAWTQLSTTLGGSYTGTIEVPQGGWYRAVVRGLGAGGKELARAVGAHRWGVGMNILLIGQSNMVGYGGNSYTKAGDLAGLYSNDHEWKHLADPYDRGGAPTDADFDAGSGASLVPSLVNTLSTYFPGLPIGVVPTARGSSPLACSGNDLCWGRRNALNPADPSTLYGNSLAEARSVGGVELIVMHQGETDATNSTPSATYGSDLVLLAHNYRVDLGEVPLFMCQLGRSTTDISAKNRTDATMQAIRVAQHEADDPPRIYLAATAIDLDVDATDHYVKPTLDELGRRIAGAIAYRYQAAGAPLAYRGPKIASVAYADATRTVIDVSLNHRGGTDFAPATGINGFVVLDGGTAVQLASVVRKDAVTIRITLKTAISGAGSVRYLHGKLPFQTLPKTVHDNTTLALPLEPTTSDLLLP